MDSERAERHLRLAAEAALRRALTPRRHDGAAHPQDIFTQCIGRLHGIATVLIAVGAVDADQAEAIMDQFQVSLGVRHLHPITPGPLFNRPSRPPGLAAGPPPPGRAAAGPAHGAAAPRVIPVGRMLYFRDEHVTGELYVMSLVLTAAQAIAPTIARVRPLARGTDLAVLRSHFPPSEAVTATDDKGITCRADFCGGSGRPGWWPGHLRIGPAPAGAQWLELSVGGRPGIRIDLTGPPEAFSATVEPLNGAPGEHLLGNVAQHVLASAAEDPGTARHTANGLGDMMTALEAAGALSPLSPTPGHLATMCERLGIDQHGITARPTADLPEPWLSVLTAYGRRHRPPARDGTATVALTLPELDGARIALTGLHTVDDQTYLHAFGCGLPPAWPSHRFGPAAHPALGWWLRDDVGHWHVAVTQEWTEDISGEATIMLRLWPPLGRETASGTLFVSTPTSRASVRVPLSWWASP